MIAEFERRLADVLSARLSPPLKGKVDLPPATGALIWLGAENVTCIEPLMGSQRPERVPNVNDPRRVLRLRCTVSVEVRKDQVGDRQQQVQHLDAVMYALDAPDFHTGQALVADGDPGFLIEEMHLLETAAPLDPAAANALPPRLTLSAEGLFWPVGVTGQTGVAIGEVRVRGIAYPLEVSPVNPDLTAGGPPVELTVRINTATANLMRLHAPDTPALPILPIGSLALSVVGPGERPGAGSLSGGAAGTGGVRIVTLTDGAASITYTPPAQPALDELVIALDNGTNGAGIEIGRFSLRTRSA